MYLFALTINVYILQFMKLLFIWITLLINCFSVINSFAQSQHLKPGFDKAELIDMLKIAGGHVDSVTIGSPDIYKKLTAPLSSAWITAGNYGSVTMELL